MIRNIVFAGCSFTWGQSLHFFAYGDESDNIHPLDGNYYENKLCYWSESNKKIR